MICSNKPFTFNRDFINERLNFEIVINIVMRVLFSVTLMSAISAVIFSPGYCKQDAGKTSSFSQDSASLHPAKTPPALDAIRALHRHLDDDKNGNVDPFESDEFLREELHYKQGYQQRQENFHRNNDDDQVSVLELWGMWVNSQVYNWTSDQTAEWVATVVELPQYSEKFRQLRINGTFLPRLAVNHDNFLTVNLGIKDFIARQKLSLKAQDAVLFGPPKDTSRSSHAKDMIFLTLMVVASSISYLVYCRNVKVSNTMMKALNKSEASLRDLQNQLVQTQRDSELKDDGFLNAISALPKENNVDEITRLQEEIKILRSKLHRAEVELQLKRWIPPQELISWLQATYDLETAEHKRKQQVAENLLKKASKACDKLKKRRGSFLYAFVPMHSRSVDEVDTAVLNARTALTQVTDEQRERAHRWTEIEKHLKPDTELETDSKSISIHVTNKQSSWSHSHSSSQQTFVETVQEHHDELESEQVHHDLKMLLNNESSLTTTVDHSSSSSSSLVKQEGRRYQSWKKVRRLLSLNEERSGSIHEKLSLLAVSDCPHPQL